MCSSSTLICAALWQNAFMPPVWNFWPICIIVGAAKPNKDVSVADYYKHAVNTGVDAELGHGVLTSLENHTALGFLINTVQIPRKIPSQHLMFGHYRFWTKHHLKRSFVGMMPALSSILIISPYVLKKTLSMLSLVPLWQSLLDPLMKQHVELRNKD